MKTILWDKLKDEAILDNGSEISIGESGIGSDGIDHNGEYVRVDKGLNPKGKPMLTKKNFYKPSEKPPAKVPVELTVLSVTGAKASNLASGKIVAKELTVFTLEVSVPLGLPSGMTKSFLVPIMRRDTGRTVYIEATIENDVMTAPITLPTSGKWVCGEDELNSDLEDELFVFVFKGFDITVVQ